MSYKKYVIVLKSRAKIIFYSKLTLDELITIIRVDHFVNLKVDDIEWQDVLKESWEQIHIRTSHIEAIAELNIDK